MSPGCLCKAWLLDLDPKAVVLWEETETDLWKYSVDNENKRRKEKEMDTNVILVYFVSLIQSLGGQNLS